MKAFTITTEYDVPHVHCNDIKDLDHEMARNVNILGDTKCRLNGQGAPVVTRNKLLQLEHANKRSDIFYK